MTNDTRWFEMAGGYVLDTLDAEERAAFERQLLSDPALRAEVDAHREAIAGLAHAAPRAAPPPALKDRIMREARASRAGGAVDEERSGAGALSPPEATGRDDARVRAGEKGPAGAARGSGPAPSVQRARRGGQWLAIAAALVVALGLGALAQQIEQRRAALADELVRTQARLDSTATRLAERDSLLSTFLGPDVVTAVLSGTDQPPSARIFWNRATSTMLVTAFNLPPAPDGRTYQLWGIAGGDAPVSLGTFQTDANGTVVVQRAAPVGVTFDIGAITEEPTGGSAQPTTAPFLVGSWTGG